MMTGAGLEAVKLSPNQKTPNEGGVLAELVQNRSRTWTSTIVEGLLFRETVPGDFATVDEAIQATARFLARPGRKAFYYRIAATGRRIIKKTRYIR